jgi:YidC/Oxa1 family membrane protein insertase
MIPFRFMALKSSLKMMRVQPKVEAIKQRYAHLKATDPKRANMNTEMMELYKVEGVNMYGSCLPMLPQLPLFYAYYRVLYNAVELRQAHWFWLTDLSAPDQSAPHDGHHDAANDGLLPAARGFRPGSLLGNK